MDDQTAALIGLGLFVASEVIGMSRYRSNSVLQMLLQIARRAFPYAITLAKTEEKPKKRRFLDSRGR